MEKYFEEGNLSEEELAFKVLILPLAKHDFFQFL